MEVLSCEGIIKSYKGLNVLKGVDFSVKRGEITSIVGSSGAGKSTLLQILGTLDKPDFGSILLEGEDPMKLNNKKLAAFRNRNIGFIFQFHNLLPELSALEKARAIHNSPSILLADEPSGNLDSKNAKDLHELFFELRDSLNLTFVIVTHNEELASISDRKVTMYDGKIIE